MDLIHNFPKGPKGSTSRHLISDAITAEALSRKVQVTFRMSHDDNYIKLQAETAEDFEIISSEEFDGNVWMRVFEYQAQRPY